MSYRVYGASVPLFQFSPIWIHVSQRIESTDAVLSIASLTSVFRSLRSQYPVFKVRRAACVPLGAGCLSARSNFTRLPSLQCGKVGLHRMYTNDGRTPDAPGIAPFGWLASSSELEWLHFLLFLCSVVQEFLEQDELYPEAPTGFHPLQTSLFQLAWRGCLRQLRALRRLCARPVRASLGSASGPWGTSASRPLHARLGSPGHSRRP
jgi:hypothetical protein